MLGLLLALASSPIDGHWLQACRGGYSREEDFAGDSAIFTERNFSALDCAHETVETVSRGTIELGPGTIDFTFSSVSLKPLDTAAWSARAVCGIRDWRAGEARDVTGRECDFTGLGQLTRVPVSGERRFGIVKILEGALYFGRLSPERNGTSPERRPVELDPEPYLKAP